MTPAKKTARKVTKQANRKPAARPARRTLTAAHKKALAGC